jgi:hypothetical protein
VLWIRGSGSPFALLLSRLSLARSSFPEGPELFLAQAHLATDGGQRLGQERALVLQPADLFGQQQDLALESFYPLSFSFHQFFEVLS